MHRSKHVVTSALVAGVTTIAALTAGAAGGGPAGATTPTDSTETAATAATAEPAETSVPPPAATEVPATSATDVPQPPEESVVETSADRSIAVNGHGAVSVTPDIASVSMGVQTRAATSQEALATLEEKSNALVTTLTAVGVAEEDIQTSGLSLFPAYGSDGTAIEGYDASTSVTVTVRDIARVGEVIDAAAGFVGPELTLGGISFSSADPEAALEEARVEAIDNARVRAEQYAAAAGVGVGDVLRIVESGVADQPFLRGAAMDMQAEASVAIEPGQQELSVNVTVVFAMT